MGPFYCPNDQTVYLDMDFFRVMEQQLGSRGEFARAYVIAHEVGHHVQDELGVLSQVNAQRGRIERARTRTRSRCGSSCRPTATPGSGRNASRADLALTDADIKSALDTAARIGDDALQRASQGRVVPDSFTHGTSEQRQELVLPRLPVAAIPTSATPSRRGSEAMAEVVNLRTLRKQRGRAEARAAGDGGGGANRRERAPRPSGGGRGRARAAAARRAPRATGRRTTAGRDARAAGRRSIR